MMKLGLALAGITLAVTTSSALAQGEAAATLFDRGDLPAAATAWGAISNDFLRNYAYTVDFDAMKIVLAARS
jgi:hypothetical protein